MFVYGVVFVWIWLGVLWLVVIVSPIGVVVSGLVVVFDWFGDFGVLWFVFGFPDLDSWFVWLASCFGLILRVGWTC